MVILSTYLIYELDKKDNSYEEPTVIISPEELSQLKVILQKNLKLIIQNGTILSFSESSGLFWKLAFLYSDILAQSIDVLIDSDEKFDKYALAIAPRGSDSDRGEFVHFQELSLEKYGGEQRLKAKAKERLHNSSVSGKLKFILSALLSGDRIYLSDGSKVE
jgi:hypothetical protein